MLKFLVTGSSGFIGKAVFFNLYQQGYNVKGTKRVPEDSFKKKSNLFYYNCIINSKTNWSSILKDIDYVIHCAGQNNDISYFANKNLKNYRITNVEGTKHLAYQAAKHGIKRLVFLSSSKVFSENSKSTFIFDHNSETLTNNPYGISKLEAEKELLEVSKKTGLEVTIIRPAIVYGNGVKGNLKKLMKLISIGVPFPLGLVKNKRSFIGLDNLVDLITKSALHPEASGKVLLASDGHDLSSIELISKISYAMNKPIKIFSPSLSTIRFIGSLIGRSSDVKRLINSFQINIDYTKQLINWTPPYNIDEGIKKMVEGYILKAK